MQNMTSIGLPTKAKSIIDMEVFALKTLDDIDLTKFKELYGNDCYKHIQDELLPMVYRRLPRATMQQISNFVKRLKETYFPSDFANLQYSSKTIMLECIFEQLSMENLKKVAISSKKENHIAEDYYVFDVFLQDTDINRTYTQAEHEDAKMHALTSVMREFCKRRFMYSAVETEAESYENAYYNAVFNICILNKDIKLAIGLAEADWMLYRIIRRRNITSNTYIMIDCIKAIAGRKYTNFTKEMSE